MLLFHTTVKAQSVKDTGHFSVHLSPVFLSSYNKYFSLQPGLQYQYKNWSGVGEFAFPLFINRRNDIER
ncbi:MAG TPA: hypothetical protein VM888_01585, partial [Chitinophagaceae bacterium]|nr:hypothetical protein [Chitinophagaceae bacterium]